MSQLPNTVEAIDVSSVPTIAEALGILWSSRDFEGQPTGVPTRSFDLRTYGALKITLKSGDVFVIDASNVDYYAPKP